MPRGRSGDLCPGSWANWAVAGGGAKKWGEEQGSRGGAGSGLTAKDWGATGPWVQPLPHKGTAHGI